MRVDELGLSQAFLPSLARAGLHHTEQLAEHDLGELLRRPELQSGAALYELLCALHRHGLTPFSARRGHIQTDRELEIFRLRAVERLTLAQIGTQVRLSPEGVRKKLKLHFGLTARAGSRKRVSAMTHQPSTLRRRHRTYLLARLVVKRSYHTRLTLKELAKSVAASPRQVQRAYAQFGETTFQDDLIARRLGAAARLLRDTPMTVSDVAQSVGYRQPAHFARAFRRRYRVSPSSYRVQTSNASQGDAREASGT